jgi:hypothetical protein
MLAAVVGILWGQGASACHLCHKTPCVFEPPQPQYECVTELVPYTVMKTRVRTDYQPVQKTVMVRQPIMQTIECQRVVCRPVYDTTYVEQRYLVQRPVTETTYVDQSVTVCRPVTTTHQVAVTCMQPVSHTVTVPVVARQHCGLGLLCGRHHGTPCAGVTTSGCTTVVQTCYQPTTVMRDVIETQMVTEVQTRKVPVISCRIVTEERVRQIPIRHCRMVQEVVVDRRQVCVGSQCVPKTITRMVPIRTCETVPVTCYKRVRRMVAVCPTPVPVIGSMWIGGPSSQSAVPSGQGAVVPAAQTTSPTDHSASLDDEREEDEETEAAA